MLCRVLVLRVEGRWVAGDAVLGAVVLVLMLICFQYSIRPHIWFISIFGQGSRMVAAKHRHSKVRDATAPFRRRPPLHLSFVQHVLMYLVISSCISPCTATCQYMHRYRICTCMLPLVSRGDQYRYRYA